MEEAKEALRDLRARTESTEHTDEGMADEVRRLEGYIAEYSKRAERAITSSIQEGED